MATPGKSRKPTESRPSLADFEARVRRLLEAEPASRNVPLRKREQAQSRFYDALDAQSSEEMLEILEETLKLNPRHPDARLVLLGLLPPPPDETITFLRQIVDDAARELGPEAFAEYQPHFWGFHETRPYMRARHELAEQLREAGRPEEAIREFEGMLELNPNDNQGVRYPLLCDYLMLDRRAEARKLMRRYPGEQKFSPVFAWVLVLLRWLTPGRRGLETALEAARKVNPYMEGYLKGHHKLPKTRPGSYALGSREEAICNADDLNRAWDRQPEARRWLMEQ